MKPAARRKGDAEAHGIDGASSVVPRCTLASVAAMDRMAPSCGPIAGRPAKGESRARGYRRPWPIRPGRPHRAGPRGWRIGIVMIPRKCSPKTMITAPAICASRIWFCRRNCPKIEAVKPRKDKDRRPAPARRTVPPAAPCGRAARAVTVHFGHGDAAHIGEVGRNDGQHAGAQKAEDARREGGQAWPAGGLRRKGRSRTCAYR